MLKKFLYDSPRYNPRATLSTALTKRFRGSARKALFSPICKILLRKFNGNFLSENDLLNSLGLRLFGSEKKGAIFEIQNCPTFAKIMKI